MLCGLSCWSLLLFMEKIFPHNYESWPSYSRYSMILRLIIDLIAKRYDNKSCTVFSLKIQASSLNPETLCPKSNGHMLTERRCTIECALTTAVKKKKRAQMKQVSVSLWLKNSQI